jgi:hypothetical protein
MDLETRQLALGPAIAMLALGLLLALQPFEELSRWDALAPLLRFFDSTFLAAALILIASGACLLAWARRARVAFFAGAAAALVLGAGMLLGTVVDAIPCMGPS